MLKKNFVEMVNAWNDGTEDGDAILSMIEDNMNSFTKYVESVVAMEQQIVIIMARFDGEEQRVRIAELDRNRRMKHERAITAIKQLNRWATMKNVQPMYTGDEDDRYAIADFAQLVVNTFFNEGKSHHRSINEMINQ